MSVCQLIRGAAALLGVLVAGAAAAVPPATAAAPPAAGDGARYALANGCYALRSQATGRLVTRDASGYRAAASDTSAAEPFHMRATDLGSYLFYGRGGDFMSAAGPLGGHGVEPAAAPSPRADWRVDVAGGAFRIDLPALRRELAAGPDGRLRLAQRGKAGEAGLFDFEPAEGCERFPEIEVGVRGEPAKGPTPYSAVSGILDAHAHLMAFELVGGGVHCGRPWHRYGVTHALVDCPDHQPNGSSAVVENLLSYGTPAGTHDTTGWPTFKDWPAPLSLTHEQTYFKWMERAWRGGLRLVVNLLVEQNTACKIYPLRRNPCDDHATILRELRHSYALQDYIDAQSGGPGKGWFRIVRSPFEARRVINQGKLAVVLGIETSELFNCGIQNNEPECTPEQVDAHLDDIHRLGVRSLELVNKVDNGFGGVAMDDGLAAPLSNGANKLETGRFFELERCPDEHHDKTQPTTVPGAERDSVFAAVLEAYLPPGQVPAYPEEPHCNAAGLTVIGEHLIRRMMAKGMIFDPDHLSVKARRQALSIIEAERYSGVISSHSWSTLDVLPRILGMGGLVVPIAPTFASREMRTGEKFVEARNDLRAVRGSKFLFGLGISSDVGGFHKQPVADDPPDRRVTYPFKSLDGSVTLDQQRSGERVYDVNVDGVAHYGLYPDWLESVRLSGGEGVARDLTRSAEAYLQMWERAAGVPGPRCRPRHDLLTRRGLGRVHLGQRPDALLRRAGQPDPHAGRAGRVWRWCARVSESRPARVTAVFTRRARVGLVASNAPGHTALGIGPGSPAGGVPSRARRLAPGVRMRRSRSGTHYVYGTRRRRVSFVAVAAPSVGSRPRALREHLRLAGLLPGS